MSDILIVKLADYLAKLQKRADICFYERRDQDMTDYYMTKIDAVRDICDFLDITVEVWKQAKEMYDFTNSGREGYTLSNGKIIKIGEE